MEHSTLISEFTLCQYSVYMGLTWNISRRRDLEAKLGTTNWPGCITLTSWPAAEGPEL